MKIYDYDGAKNLCGDRIRQARVVKRLTQGDLTAKMQLTGVRIEREAISKIESGERFVADYELVNFARVLGVRWSGLSAWNEKFFKKSPLPYTVGGIFCILRGH